MAILVTLVAVCVVLLFRPLDGERFPAQPHPASSIADALVRIDSLCAIDGPPIASECGTPLLTHGAAAPRVVVL